MIFCYNCQCETKQIILFEKGEVYIPEVVPFSADGKRIESFWTIEARIFNYINVRAVRKLILMYIEDLTQRRRI